ncbi:unnamed protein product [Rhizoctonia solani]|uniref:Zn(2)-C6 fungal-type domain-containing protein n=1 Tax=Rhizoctonia solani TaxID=456999 RepID=A0A8H3HYJ6_9AGAM|nr:unnamed protein product [Rhizoctonia solani]
MSHESNSSCVTCQARKKKCDGTNSLGGCRRCVQAGITCEGYLPVSSRISKSKRNARKNVKEVHTNLANKSHAKHINHSKIAGIVASSTCPLVLNIPSALVENDNRRDSDLCSRGFPAGPWEHTHMPSDVLQFPISPTDHLCLPAGQVPTPNNASAANKSLDPQDRSTPAVQIPAFSSSQFTTPNSQFPTPPSQGSTPLPFAGQDPISPSRANPAHSRYFPAKDAPGLLFTPSSWGPGLRAGYSSGLKAPAGPSSNQPSYDPRDDQDDDPEKLRESLYDVLVLDRQVESNTVSFVLQSFVSWMSRFLFEPTRVITLVRKAIIRGRTFGPENHHEMLRVANIVFTVAKSTDYDFDPFMDLYNHHLKDITSVRARVNLTREMAVATMESWHEFISIMWKICSFASVLKTMGLYASIFRRACPESDQELVNLPNALTTTEINLKLFATLDILISVIANRPMFFRYDLEFSSSQQEKLLCSEDSPGLRWLYGVPDRLVVTLARMNTLYEDFGGCVDQGTVLELEKEISACVFTVSPVALDPVLMLGRIVVQECWRLVAFVYLYMGLCGANSADERVVKAQKTFMNILGGVKPCRNPDSFLIVPMMVVGVATTSHTDQTILLSRIWGVAECNKQGTVGNDIFRIINDIWTRTRNRPAVWSDLRFACLKVTGM